MNLSSNSIKAIFTMALFSYSIQSFSQCYGMCIDELSPQKILPLFFESNNFKNNKVVWKPTFEDNVKLRSVDFIHQKYSTKIDTIFYFYEESKKNAVVIFETDAIHNCHVCAPTIGLAKFKLTDTNQWEVLSFNKLFIRHGSWGKKDYFYFDKIGFEKDSLNVLVFNSIYSQGGVVSEHIDIVLLNRNTSIFPIIFSIGVYFTNGGEYSTDNPQYINSKTTLLYYPNSDIKTITTTNNKDGETITSQLYKISLLANKYEAVYSP
jgi:hypothetical protein